MCGTLKLEGFKFNIGGEIPVYQREVQGLRRFLARWTGFAQEEKLSWWQRPGDQIVFGKIEAFWEHGQELDVEQGSAANFLLLNREVYIGAGEIIARPGEVKLITRRPATDYERRLHNRFPIILSKKVEGRTQRIVFEGRQGTLWSTAQDHQRGIRQGY